MELDKIERARRLRDLAVKLARTGSSELVVHWVSDAYPILFNALVFRSGELKIYYRTPFQRLSPLSDEAKQLAATLKVVYANRPFGVEIYYGEKVFDAGWDEGSPVDVATYKPGAWEAEMEQLAS